ncbi:DUF6417 family protein [Streptomyces sp. NPDC006622]|uniref:DUF6417 family protein n=1 Tax=Streptomyces sp. NPDC006622 TaxID=3155459 RepID=UPI0033AD6CB1
MTTTFYGKPGVPPQQATVWAGRRWRGVLPRAPRPMPRPMPRTSPVQPRALHSRIDFAPVEYDGMRLPLLAPGETHILLRVLRTVAAEDGPVAAEADGL